MVHQMLLVLKQGKLFHAPVANPRQVLDVGTGTGIWAIDVADHFRSATVTGVDLSPTQPQHVPPNCKFQIDDASKEWTFRKNHFDFIHIRHLLVPTPFFQPP